MKIKLKTGWKKFKCAFKEVLNLLTNLLTPFVSALCLLAELLQLPTGVIQGLKKAEYWCWNACGTSKHIDQFVEQVDDMVDMTFEEDDSDRNGDNPSV